VRPRLALACLATVVAADYVIHTRSPSWFAIGPLDHAAHLATAALLLPAGWSRPRQASFMAGSLLPDVDHVPLAFQDPEPGDPRPRTHSLIALGPALLSSRSTAAGMAAHYVRDLALEPGVPFLGGRHLKAPYTLYAALIGVAAYWKACAPSSPRF
jgi:hypothetical protein